MLLDNFNRQINYLRISITDRCNLRCIYCLPEEGIGLLPSAEIIRYEEISRLLNIMAKLGITKVRLTGGEPLLRSNLVELIRNVKGISGIKDLSLTTNGTLLYEQIDELFKSGLRRINISLNTLKKERYTKITAQNGMLFKQVIDGIYKALSLGMNPVKINVVALKGINDDEFVDFAGLAREQNLQVRFIEYMPIKRREIDWNDTFIPIGAIQSIIEKKYGKLIPVDNLDKGPARYFKIKGAKGKLGFISPISFHFCGNCNRLRLTSDGKLRVCLFSDKEVDIKKVLRNGACEEDIIRFVKEAVSSKPAKHNLTLEQSEFIECRRSMAEIGG